MIDVGLFTAYEQCIAVEKMIPYDGDKRQAIGTLFARLWNANKEAICEVLGEPTKEFDYAKWRYWLPRLIALRSATTGLDGA